ncbi:hypothetical protein BOX15_Mlig010969g1 [Macrostomum lignano]|uniref:Class I SAM-dependent methyltransferase n=1 Tax=Macrostomum lignano TaxID=282301 RepID=A0A267G3J7_9PLAT|nr:hypothetical protein BOX15_Mlig010969g1 [Macrostomum lignano]
MGRRKIEKQTSVKKSNRKTIVKMTKKAEKRSTRRNGANKKKPSVKHLSHFLRIYKGLEDWHIPIFAAVKQFCGNIATVMYPGCDKHLTASLIFDNVTYIDLNSKMLPFFNDPAIHSWIEENKQYTRPTIYSFENTNFDRFVPVNNKPYDLVISASAGLVSNSACMNYLKNGGHFLVSDAHFDARNAYTKTDFSLVAVYDSESGQLISEKKCLDDYFLTTEKKKITKVQVEESVSKPKNKRSFKLIKEPSACFFLFKKIK